MSTLNKAPSEAMMEVGVNACTDITGFGLLGHLQSMMEASKVAARVYLSSVPLLEGTRELAQQGIAPGGTQRNLESVSRVARWDASLSQEDRTILCDAQTSGGLLISVPRDKTQSLLDTLVGKGIRDAAIVGEVVEREAESVLDVLP